MRPFKSAGHIGCDKSAGGRSSLCISAEMPVLSMRCRGQGDVVGFSVAGIGITPASLEASRGGMSTALRR